MRYQPLWDALCLYLFGCLAESKRFSLREDVGQEHVVMPAELRQCVTEGDKITRNKARALVDQLIERMLPVRSRFTPIDRPGIVVDLFAIQSDVLAVTLHRQLLEISRKSFQVLLVGKDSDCLRIEEIRVPECE